MEVWSPGKRAVFWMAGKASSSTDTAQGPCELGLVFQDWGKLPRGSLLVGGLPGACPAQHPDYKPASYGSENAISCGLPPSSCIRKRGHLYGRKNRGIFAVVGTGRRGLRVCRYVGQLLAPRPHVSEPHGGRGTLIAGCRCPAGVKGRRGHSAGDREGLGLERVPGKIPSPGPSGSRGFQRLLPWGLVLLSRARVRRR